MLEIEVQFQWSSRVLFNMGNDYYYVFWLYFPENYHLILMCNFLKYYKSKYTKEKCLTLQAATLDAFWYYLLLLLLLQWSL